VKNDIEQAVPRASGARLPTIGVCGGYSSFCFRPMKCSYVKFRLETDFWQTGYSILYKQFMGLFKLYERVRVVFLVTRCELVAGAIPRPNDCDRTE
jgi:hypothetical protein